MNTDHLLRAATASFFVLALAACGSDDGGSSPDEGEPSTTDGGYGAPPTTDEENSGGDAVGAALRTAETDLGTIVVDGDGMVVYQFDSDEQGSGTSTCEGQCAQNWPTVPGDVAPDLDGIDGGVDTITGVDGAPQLTLNGWPLYYYVGDQDPGDTSGQGVGDIWWVLTPDGEPLRD